jgi:hypothetical protein
MKIVPPVLFLIFNRPEITQKVFNVIRKVKPLRLFVAADGPRKGSSEDIQKCINARDIIKQVDWNCKVELLYRDHNLGCKVAVISAINWFFESVESGIILEDDCLPSPSFFWFCGELLERYQNSKQIMQINGNFHLNKVREFSDSYYFSKLNGCWGWATWRRSWELFDPHMECYKQSKESDDIFKYYGNQDISNWMESYLDEASMPVCGIWSTQWAYSILRNNGLCINPTVNLVNNVGFFNSPTSGIHKSFEPYSSYRLENISKIVHPKKISYNPLNDELEFNLIIKKTDPRLLPKGFKYFLQKIIHKLYVGK